MIGKQGNEDFKKKSRLSRAELEGRKKIASGKKRVYSGRKKDEDSSAPRHYGHSSKRPDNKGGDGKGERAAYGSRRNARSGNRLSSLAAVEADIEAMNRKAEEEEKKQADAVPDEADAGEMPMGFDSLPISEEIMRATNEMGFEQMSPIQARAIPVMMTGKDMIGQAQTGTGKTAAFAIPLLMKTDPKDRQLQALVLCPTRELAVQVAEEIRRLAKFMHGVRVLPIYGGQSIATQLRSLKGGVQIVVGTPGRVMDHLDRHTLKLDGLHTIVLDEADEMLDMGFVDDIRSILSTAPQERQTVLFSATMPQAIMDIATQFQKDAEVVRVVNRELTVPKIDQFYCDVRPDQKTEALCRLFEMYSPERSLVFCNTRRKVDELTAELKGRGYFAEGLHGDLDQNQRDRVMGSFRKGLTNILIATDVAARGIDVDDIEAVFNYDLPQDDEYYVHRIGRTGRAGKAGVSFTFVVGKEVYKLRDIQRYCKTRIRARSIPSEDEAIAARADRLLDKVSDCIEHNDLKDMIDVLENRINSSDYSAMDVAAALLKMAMGEKETEEKEIADEDFENTGAAEDGMARLFISVGKADGIRPGDIVGSIAGETGIDGHVIGRIDMFDKYTFVEVPKENARQVIEAMKASRIRGNSIRIEPAGRPEQG